MAVTLGKKFTVKMRLQWKRTQEVIKEKKKSQEEFASLKFWYGFWAFFKYQQVYKAQVRPSSFNPFLIWWNSTHPELISVILYTHNYVKVSSESKNINCTVQKSIYPCFLLFNSFWSTFLILCIRLIVPIYSF